MDSEHKLGPMVPMVPMRRSFSLVPQTLGEAMELARMIADSEMAPKDYRGKPANIVIAIQMGIDLGLKPMQALQNIAVINGRPAIWGDAVPALIQASGVLERFHETITGEGDKRTATCIIKRKGMPDEVVRTFSVADAKLAKLWGKTGSSGQATPWVTYPDRMLQMRARGFAVRDACADCLMGLILAEEAGDLPPNTLEGTVVSSEIVEDSPAMVVFKRLPEPMRDSIEKGFATLNLAAGLRLTKLNEFLLATDGTDDEKGANLQRWLKDEYARRKTGQPAVAKKPDNGKAAAPVKEAGGGTAGASAPLGTVGVPTSTEVAGPGPSSPAAVTTPVTSGQVDWGKEKPTDSLGF